MNKADAKEPLDVVARQIEAHAKKSDESLISAAMLVREARRRIDDGEAGGITWEDWAAKNINLSPSRLRELQRIAQAVDPAAELERQRGATRRRVAAHRAKKAAKNRELEPERRELIAWAKTVNREKVRQVLHQVKQRADDAEAASIEGQPTEGRQEAA